MSRGYPQPYPFANGSNRTYGTYNQGSDRYDAGYRRPSEQESDTAGRERRAAEYGMHGGGNGSMPQQTSYQLGSRGSEPELGQDSYRRPDRPDRAWSSQGRSTDIARHDDSDMGFEPQERSKQIEDVLNLIQRDWNFMTEESCVPVQVALQLMDSSSLGRAHQLDQFQETHAQLQEALKGVVNEYHLGFSSAMGAFHNIQAGIQSSQTRVRALRDSLVVAKSNLSTTKPELKGLAASSQEYDDMLQVLSHIEQLQLIPEILEARIFEKKFLAAVDVLQDGLRLIRMSDMGQIGALTDLTVYISNQETVLTDILIEELHNHLYLKSPYCNDRWQSYALDLRQGATLHNDRGTAALPAHKTIYQFLERLDLSTSMIEEPSRNPEADNFYYIHLLLESLNRLGRLDLTVESIEQRMPTELFRLVGRTCIDVEQRYRDAVVSSLSYETNSYDSEFGEDDLRETIISDFLYTLFSKFEAIAEGHRVVHDVITGILKRGNVRDTASLTGGFRELWKLYQNEIRTILHDYLATDGQSSLRSARGQTGSGSLFQKFHRDKSKKIFMFSHIDSSVPELAAAQDDLEAILRLSVPGLVSESQRPLGVAGSDSNTQNDGSATGHKLLVKPSVFNMGYLLPPSLTFLQRLREIVPDGADIDISQLTSFLDDFLINVFHPQLDEALTDLSAHIFIELDAFQQDPQCAHIAKKPIFKGTSAFSDLIRTFCRMLDTIPRDPAVTQLIITQMITYFDKCRGHYKSLVTRAQSQTEGGIRLKVAAALSESEDLRKVCTKLLQGDLEDQQRVLDQEAKLLIAYTLETPLEPSSVISDRKAIRSLCLLYTSMKWLASKLSRLRRVVEDDAPQQGDHNRRRVQWNLRSPTYSKKDPSSIYLPLTEENATAFDAVVSSYEELATSVLLTLHMDMRANVMLGVTKSIRNNYLLEQRINEPDHDILNLNAELVSFDEDVSTYLRPQEHKFIVTGLGVLIDTMLVTHAGQIGAMNAHGCERMQLNMLVLQQNLKNIEPDIALTRGAQFFELFAAGPDAIIAKVKEASGGGDKDLGFTYDELKILVELCYSESLASDRREVAVQAKRQLNDHLLQLSEHTWQSE